jgi:hypothetical protein
VDNVTHPDAPRTSSPAKYRGLNNTVIASFQPKTTNTPYIHTGICATLDTILLFASTYAASASLLKRFSSETSLVGERRVKAVLESYSVRSGSVSGSELISGLGRVGRSEDSEGAMVAKRGSNESVSSLALRKADSISSDGFHTLGTPASSYLKRSSKEDRSVARIVASEVCSSSLRRSDIHDRARRVAMAESFSSDVQL